MFDIFSSSKPNATKYAIKWWNINAGKFMLTEFKTRTAAQKELPSYKKRWKQERDKTLKGITEKLRQQGYASKIIAQVVASSKKDTQNAPTIISYKKRPF